jgi:hypothetical protein
MLYFCVMPFEVIAYLYVIGFFYLWMLESIRCLYWFAHYQKTGAKSFLSQRSNCEIARQPSISEVQATITKNTISGNAILSTFFFRQNKEWHKQESGQRYIVIQRYNHINIFKYDDMIFSKDCQQLLCHRYIDIQRYLPY